MEAPTKTKFGWWSRLACVVVSAVALWLVFRRIDGAALGHAFHRVKLGWLAAAVLMFGFALLCAACRWHLMLRQAGAGVHSAATWHAVLIGHFFNTLLFGPAGGDIAKTVLYCRWFRHSMTDVLAASFLDRLLGFAGLIVFAGMAFGLAAFTGGYAAFQEVRFVVPRSWLIAGFILSTVVLAFLFFHRRRRPDSFLGRTLGAIHYGGARLLALPRIAGPGLLLGFLVQAATTGVMALCLQAVSPVPLAWANLAWTFPVIAVIAAVPVTVGGSGVREGAALVFLGFYGVAAADAVAGSLLVFATLMFWALVGGGVWWWEMRARSRPKEQQAARTISVVIPTLNEATALAETVKRARQLSEVCEIIVVDGGSRDGTPRLAQQLGCRVLDSAPGRGGQMRRGASQATGEVVMLLHADTWLPPEAGRAVFACLRDEMVVGGGFWKIFREPSWLMFGSRWRCALRLFLGQRIAGDQVIFIRRAALEQIAGVPDLPLMEEFELCRRLRNVGRLALAGATVSTSARRFAKLGVWRTYLRMWRVALQFRLGTPAHELVRLYEKE